MILLECRESRAEKSLHMDKFMLQILYMIKIDPAFFVMRSYSKFNASNQIAVKLLEWKIVFNKTFTALYTLYSLIWPVHMALVHQNHKSSTIDMLNDN